MLKLSTLLLNFPQTIKWLLTGLLKVQLLLLKTKAAAVHAGLSPLLVVLKVSMSSN